MSTDYDSPVITDQCEAETLCREFAARYPSDNVRRAIALAEFGHITWNDVAGLLCREFAARYPSDNVRRAIALAESGHITWNDVAGLFRRALTKALGEVAS